MIDVRTEHLLPLNDLPEYLESRGLGRRVSMRAVRTWIRVGYRGARLESVRIGDSILTSEEAVQRWVQAQNCAGAAANASASSAERARQLPQGPSSEHRASMHLLVEHRVFSTELDRLIRSLPGHAKSTLSYASGVLFRAGLRTVEHARQCGREGLLATTGIGPRTAPVVESLWLVLLRGVAGGSPS